jgi:hypothetical protein
MMDIVPRAVMENYWTFTLGMVILLAALIAVYMYIKKQNEDEEEE